ncbi:MFS transporter [Pseudonocardia lacus]|uniref:MFS transporter n=1 Tax=Pseudonocardia lacus TaxID=2835865 RepID=UPI0027E3B24F|nr:MFS transporter [Pseudonocardia lacus]
MPDSSIRAYREALTTPGAGVPALFSALGRLPIAMVGLAMLLYVQQVTGSFAMAGLVGAGGLVGVSAGSVVQGRVIDRIGATRPLLVASALFAVAVTALVGAVQAGQGVALLVALAVLTGITQPAVEGAARALWGRLIPAGPVRDAAFTYEAISLEVFFILGPALAALLVAVTPWPGTAVVVAAGVMVAGSVGFALTRPVRTEPARVAGDGPKLGLLGAIARPGMRTVALASLGFGMVVGTVEVGVPAVTAQAGSAALGGVLLSAWSVASVLAGVLYSMRPWPRPLHLRMPVLLGAFAVLVAAMSLTGPLDSLTALVVAMVAAGALITPQVTAHSLAVDLASPPGTAAEGFGWVVTAATLGLAGGQSAGGAVVEAVGPPAAFVVGGVAGMVVAVVLWARRGTLAPQPRPVPV